jgi:ABC-type nitrate/sulfonate/bicarbonate transport system permease component
LLLLATIVVAWQAAAMADVLNPALLPAPTSIGHALVVWTRSGLLLIDIAASTSRVIVGFGLAIAIAGPVGVALALSPVLARQISIVVELMRPIPPIAWIPLAILWFGIGNGSAYFIVALGAFFPIVTGVYLGLSSVRMSSINAARSLGAGKLLLLTDVLLPAALPTMLGGLRSGLGVAWMSLIAAELVGTQAGLGYRLQLGRIMLNTEEVIAGMLVIGATGLLMGRVLLSAERRWTRWNRETVQHRQHSA